MTDIKKCLENIENKAVDYKKTVNRKSKQIPEELVDKLLSIWEEKQTRFAIPIKPVNEAIGFSGDLNKEKSALIKKKLNDQWKDKLEEGTFFHMGTGNNGEVYTFSIEQVKED